MKPRTAVFAERLRSARLSRHLTQPALGEKVGVSMKSISHYERAVSEPISDLVIKLAAVLEVSADYLFGFTDEARPRGNRVDPNPTKTDEARPRGNRVDLNPSKGVSAKDLTRDRERLRALVQQMQEAQRLQKVYFRTLDHYTLVQAQKAQKALRETVAALAAELQAEVDP